MADIKTIKQEIVEAAKAEEKTQTQQNGAKDSSDMEHDPLYYNQSWTQVQKTCIRSSKT